MQWKKTISANNQISSPSQGIDSTGTHGPSLTQKTELGLVLGDGNLAYRVLEIASSRFDAYVCFLEQTNYKRAINEKLPICSSIRANLTQIKKILNFFESKNIYKVVLVGGVSRPNIFSLAFADSEFKLLLKRIQSSGDSKAGALIIQFLEERGFSVIGCHQVAPEVLIPRGLYVGSLKDVVKDARAGFQFIKLASPFDLFQSVVVKNGHILAVEDVFGTDKLISRFAKSGIKDLALVKAKKVNQDPRFDLPCIGVQTVENMLKSGFKFLIVEADSVVTDNLANLIKAASQHGLAFASLSLDQLFDPSSLLELEGTAELITKIVTKPETELVSDQAR